MAAVLGGVAGRVSVVGCSECVKVEGCGEFVLFLHAVQSEATGEAVIGLRCEVGLVAV